ncbi:MAG: helix-turn-helix domain-containing protein [Bacillota bacterium]
MQNLGIKEIETANFYTPADISKILKVSTNTVYRWINLGLLSGFKFGGAYRVTQEDLEIFLKNSFLRNK